MDACVLKGSTPSRNTGPTSAIEGQYYMYIEASPPVQEGHVARLISKEKYAGTCNTQSFHLRIQIMLNVLLVISYVVQS